MDLLKEFPALWVLMGGILSAFMFWFLNRNVFSLTQSAQAQLAKTYKEQIDAVTNEKDFYRQKAQEQSGELQKFALRVSDLESKPDLTKIFESYREEANRRFALYQEQSRVLERLANLIQEVITKFNAQENLLGELINKTLNGHVQPV